MTKKKALKMIMACGFQRNEAQRYLSLLRKKGLNNKEAVIKFRLLYAIFCIKKVLEAETGDSLNIKDLIAGAVQVPFNNLFPGGIVYENPGH